MNNKERNNLAQEMTPVEVVTLRTPPLGLGKIAGKTIKTALLVGLWVGGFVLLLPLVMTAWVFTSAMKRGNRY
jgi:hypothetical protein